MSQGSEHTARRLRSVSRASSAWYLFALGVVAGCGTDNDSALFGSRDEIAHDSGAVIVGRGGKSAGTGGTTTEGSGGIAATGGSAGSSGATSSGAASNASGGARNSGGAPHAGGSSNAAGAPSSGGSVSAGGTKNTGGLANTGGKPNAGGTSGTGGAHNAGGASDTGGAIGSGGRFGAGGSAGAAGKGAGGAIPECAGTPPSCTSLAQTECATVSGCTAGVCRGAYCPSTRPDACNKVKGCSWNGDSMYCQGFPSECPQFTTGAECASQQGCTWTPGCQGTPTACTAFKRADCANHPGCAPPFRVQPDAPGPR